MSLTVTVQCSFSVSPPTVLEHDFLFVVWIHPWQLQSAADTPQLGGSLNHSQPSLGGSLHLIPGCCCHHRLWWHIMKCFNPHRIPLRSMCLLRTHLMVLQSVWEMNSRSLSNLVQMKHCCLISFFVFYFLELVNNTSERWKASHSSAFRL